MGGASAGKHPGYRRRAAYWLVSLFVIGAAFWGFNEAWVRVNQAEVAAYVKVNALDVIELKNGRKSIGKIVGETPQSYFIKNTKGAEEKIDRNVVKIKRMASGEELEIARVLLTKRINRPAAQKMTVWERARCAFGSVANRIEAEAKYFREVAAARQARSNLERKLAEEKAKENKEAATLEDQLKEIYYGGMAAKKEE